LSSVQIAFFVYFTATCPAEHIVLTAHAAGCAYLNCYLPAICLMFQTDGS